MRKSRKVVASLLVGITVAMFSAAILAVFVPNKPNVEEDVEYA